jgi:hypothetical protein
VNAIDGFSPASIEFASPLFAAIHIGNGEPVSYLLKHKADPNHSFRGISPKDYAEKKNQHEIAHLLDL